MERKHLTSIRLSPVGKRLLEMLAAELGVSQTAVLEMCIREYARQWTAKTQGDSIMDVRSALHVLANSVDTLRDKYETVGINALVAKDAAAREPEFEHLIPLLEQMSELSRASFDQFMDAIPSEVGDLMEAAQEFANDE